MIRKFRTKRQVLNLGLGLGTLCEGDFYSLMLEWGDGNTGLKFLQSYKKELLRHRTFHKTISANTFVERLLILRLEMTLASECSCSRNEDIALFLVFRAPTQAITYYTCIYMYNKSASSLEQSVQNAASYIDQNACLTPLLICICTCTCIYMYSEYLLVKNAPKLHR